MGIRIFVGEREIPLPLWFATVPEILPVRAEALLLCVLTVFWEG